MCGPGSVASPSPSAVAMAWRVSAWRVGDTQHPSPMLSELVRWTADQVGKTSRSATKQALGVPAMQLQAC